MYPAMNEVKKIVEDAPAALRAYVNSRLKNIAKFVDVAEDIFASAQKICHIDISSGRYF